MSEVSIRKGKKTDAPEFITLLKGLAEFEHLEPPSRAGRDRLLDDIFRKKRIRLFVAVESGHLVGYALYFYTYSSFLAKPTLYLEDLYVPEVHRKKGIGFTLFRKCVDEAASHGCGRMEWSVLAWNRNARAFYERLGAKWLEDWVVYRLDEAGIRRVPRVRP